MNSLKAKFRKQGGFTLIEMLIVVALIAILVAISIPLVNSSLEKAQHGTDAANERAAKSEIMMCYMTGAPISDGTTKVTATDDGSTKYYYNAQKGWLESASTGVGSYGKCPTHKDGCVAVGMKKNGEVVIQWENVKDKTDPVTDLCMTAVNTDA